MKYLVLIVLVLTLSKGLDACSCRHEWTADYFAFFKKNGTKFFVGEVISISENSKFLIFEFKVVDKLRGSFADKEFVYARKDGYCTLYLKRAVYLIKVNRFGGRLTADDCSFKEENTSRTFREDTALINLFEKKSYEVNSTYFKGKVINGKRSGTWIQYYNNDTTKVYRFGDFQNDKKEGPWICNNDTTIYNKGKFVQAIWHWPGDEKKFRIVETPETATVFYDDGKIYKRRSQNTFLVFYPDGKLKESVSIDKRGYFCKTWTKYNEDGTIKESLTLTKEHSYHASDFLTN